jgi:hypothetical protein
MSPKLFNVYLGYEPVGRSVGYTTRAEAVKAARRIAASARCLRVRTVSCTDRETGRLWMPLLLNGSTAMGLDQSSELRCWIFGPAN